MSQRSMLARMKTRVPWWVKIAAKLVLSRLPIPYAAWKRLSLFEHGAMDDAGYALRTFQAHFRRSGVAAREAPFVALELGPGDSIGGGMAARAHGASAVYLVDAGAYAARDPAALERMAAALARAGLAVPALPSAPTLEQVLAAYGIDYRTDGLNSLRTIPGGSVHLIWSQAVLEHIPRAEFEPTLRELRRVLAPGGVCSHRVDLRDHLGGSLHNLRFSERLWESRWMVAGGFYTNRLRHAEQVAVFERCGFRVETLRIERWPALPLPRHALHPAFRTFSDHELRIAGFDVLLRPV